MNWPWADSLEPIWHSQAFPTSLTLAAAGFFGIIALITLLRAEKSVANGALTVITLLAVGIAVASTIRGFDTAGISSSGSNPSPPAMIAASPALACLDDLAGDAVLTSCEKSVFGSAESVAAALSYAASQISRLTAFGDVAAANKSLTPEFEALRRAVEHDRYGLMAYVLTVRDHCTPSDCAAFRALTDHRHIAANMNERLYDTLVLRYVPSWVPPSASAPVAALVPGVPTGRPTNAEFPSAASTPPVSIMTAEPSTAATSSTPRSAGPAVNAPPASPRPSPSASPAVAAAKKPPPPKPPRTPAPVAAAPAPPAPAAAPAASNE
jgi:hypothetical protein